MRSIYIKVYGIDDQTLKFEKNETYYKLINKLKDSIHKARREILKYNEQRKSIGHIIISNMHSKPDVEVLT